MNLRNSPRLKDEGHICVKCSNCNAPLADIWSVDKSLPITWKIKVECPHCNDHSFVYEVKGRYYYGPGLINYDKDDTEGEKDKIYTIIDYIEDTGDILIFKTKKGLEWNG